MKFYESLKEAPDASRSWRSADLAQDLAGSLTLRRDTYGKKRQWRRREKKRTKIQQDTKKTKGKKKEKQKHHLIFYNEDVFRLPLLFQVLLRTIPLLFLFIFPLRRSSPVET